MRTKTLAVVAGLLALAGSIGLAVPASAAAPALAPSNCGKLNHNADGTVSPMICPDRHPNAKAWKYVADGTPHLAALPARPSWKQVKAAACADLLNASNPIVTDSYQWLAARHGWLAAGLPGAETFGARLVKGLCD